MRKLLLHSFLAMRRPLSRYVKFEFDQRRKHVEHSWCIKLPLLHYTVLYSTVSPTHIYLCRQNELTMAMRSMHCRGLEAVCWSKVVWTTPLLLVLCVTRALTWVFWMNIWRPCTMCWHPCVSASKQIKSRLGRDLDLDRGRCQVDWVPTPHHTTPSNWSHLQWYVDVDVDESEQEPCLFLISSIHLFVCLLVSKSLSAILCVLKRL